MRPAKGILDPAFRYRPSHATDIRKTFERVRQQLTQAPVHKVVPLERHKKPVEALKAV
jgi:hypothetical protein